MIGLALGRFLLRTPWSTFMALVGVTLGVVSIVSVHLISATINTRLDTLVPQQLAGYTHFLHHDSISAEDYFELRLKWRQGQFPKIVSLAPLIDESQVIDGHRVRVIGLDLFSSSDGLAGMGIVQAPQAFNWSGVWVDESLIDQLSLPINGILSAPEGTLVADIGTAQTILDWTDNQISYIGLELEEPLATPIRWIEQLLPGFSAGFSSPESGFDSLSEFELLSFSDQHPARSFGQSILFNISALGLLALLVAWFLIYQVAVSWLRRLWPVLQRLHIIGVEWHRLALYFVGALACLGSVAGVVGLALGYGLAHILLSAMTEVSMPQLDADIWVFTKALASSVGVCLVGGLWAIHKARMTQVGKAKKLRLLVLTAVAVYCIVAPSTGLAGGFLGIALLSIFTALLVTPVLSWLRLKADRVRGPYLVRLSLRESIWYPQDMSVALAGLSLAVATAIGVGLMVDSFRGDFASMLDRRLSYDLVVQGGHEDLSALRDVLRKNDSVDRLQTYAETPVRVRGVPLTLVSTRLDQWEARRYGYAWGLDQNEILVGEQAAQLLNVDVGETLSLPGGDFVIAGQFSSFGDVVPRVIVPTNASFVVRNNQITSLSIALANASRQRDVLAEQFSELEFVLQAQLRRSALETFDQTFSITTVLLFIAMLVASLGVYIATTALRLNKQAHGALLTQMGVSPSQMFVMDLSLGLGMGAVAMLFAVPLGLSFGWILCTVINPRAFGWSVSMHLSLQAIVIPVLLGMMAAGVAGIVRVGRGEDGVSRATR